MLNSIILISALAMSANIPELTGQLQNEDPAVRRNAAEALCRLGSDAQTAATALVIATGDADEQTQQWANAALEELGPPPAADIAKLGEVLTSIESSADTAYWAATLLGRLESDGTQAVQPLTQAAETHHAMSVRERAVWALGKIGPAADSAKPLLEQLSTVDQPRLAKLAKTALTKIQASTD